MDSAHGVWHYPVMLARTPEHALQYRRLRETVILFTLFVVPGLTSSTPIAQVVGAVAPLTALTIRNIAFALLILYLLDIQGERQLVLHRRSEGEAFPLGIMVRVFGVLLGVSVAVSVVSSVISGTESAVGTHAIIPALRDRYSPVVWVPIITVAMVSVGIAEELLFRGYFITRFQQLGRSTRSAVLISAALFSIGHGYQGVAALVFSFLAGSILGVLWVKRPHLGAFAAGHAVYNLAALALSMWYSSS
ncbi:MAG: CPBP family intramembrane glutamic endopeptidase [Alkalispirochaeta sp.]